MADCLDGVCATGCEWADVLPLLEAVDTLRELQVALEDPAGFLEGLTQAGTPLARKLALRAAKHVVIARARPVLEPHLLKQQLAWADVVPALDAVDTHEELQAAVSNPATFLSQLLTDVAGPAARKMALARLRPALEPHLQKHSLEWSDVLPALDAADTLEELQAAVSDPAAFLSQLLTDVAGPAARKMALARLRPALEPHLQKHSLEWTDVLPLVEAVDTLEELQAALGDPRAFAMKLALASKAAAKKLAKQQLKKRLPKKPPKQKFEIDKAKVPVEFQRLYALFFDASSKMNMVSPSPHSHVASSIASCITPLLPLTALCSVPHVSLMFLFRPFRFTALTMSATPFHR